MTTPEEKRASDDEVRLLDYLNVLAKHSRMIVFVSAGLSALTLLILLLFPNQYTAVARLLPPQQNLTLSAQLMDQLGGSALPLASAGAAGLGGMAANLLGLKSPGDLYVGMLTGNTIFDRIIKRFGLREYYRPWYSFKEPYIIEDIREKLEKRAEISVGKDGIISIEVADEDPQMAAKMANAFIEELDKLLQGMAKKEAKERLAFVEKERSQTMLNLSRAEESLRAFSEQSSVLQIDAQTKGMIEYIATLRAAIDAKEVQIKVMRQQATPYNYDVIQLETELQGLKEKVRAAEAQESTNPRQGDVMIATSKVPALGLEYLRLYREAKFQEGLYQLYCKLAELARTDQVRDATVLQIVDLASVPEKKSRPKRLLLTILVGIASFFILVFGAFVWEFCQKTTKADEDGLDQFYGYIRQWRWDAQRLTQWFKRKKTH